MTRSKPKVLVVDDKSRYIELSHAMLRQYDYAVRCELSGPCWTCESRKGCTLTHAHDWSETLQALAKHPDVDVVLLDLVFDLPKERLLPAEDGDPERSRRLQGIEILKRLRGRFGSLPVVLMTSMEELRFEEEALALSVDEFVVPAGTDAFDARAIGMLIERILARQTPESTTAEYLFGSSPQMAALRRAAATLARTSLPMLILGETGVGKSALVEKVIHPASKRKGPLVTVDLAALPETLIAAELFGTVRGAFSGAVERIGCLERAAHGTLFLDEIGNLKEDVQRMLLVTLQSGRFFRLGESVPRQSDVKLITASNCDLDAAVREGRFRQDLYARLNPAARLVVPPLGDRKDDILSFMEFFVQKTFADPANRTLLDDYIRCCKLPGPVEVALAVDAPTGQGAGVQFVLSRRNLENIKGHRFSGNVRELEMMTATMVLFALLDALRAAEEGRGSHLSSAIPLSSKLIRELQNAPTGKDTVPVPIDPTAIPVWVAPAVNLRDAIRNIEKEIFLFLFKNTGGDFEAMAARLLSGDRAVNARRVRLRFNQLGLKVRSFQKSRQIPKR